MSNGNSAHLLSLLREMAERKEIAPDIGLPLVFQALVDIIMGQKNIVEENKEYRKSREREIADYREKRERKDKEYQEESDAKHMTCESRLVELENAKDVKIALIGASGVGVGALITAIASILLGIL